MKNVLFFVLYFFAFTAYSQDFIIRTNGDRIAAKVLEIDKYIVTYKQFDNQQGPSYKVNKSEIAKIEYQNGTIENYNVPVAQGGAPSSPYNTNFNRNLLSFDFVSIIFSEVGLSYEHIVGTGVIGIKIPFIFGFDIPEYEEFRRVSNNFVTGLDINLYPTGQGRARYFVGPGIRLGSVDVTREFHDPFFGPPYSERVRTTLTAFQVNNGVMFQPTPNFTISLVLGIGIRNVVDHDDFFNLSPNYGTFGANISYRF